MSITAQFCLPAILLFGILASIGCQEPAIEVVYVASNADDDRTTASLLDSAINRTHLSVPGFWKANPRFQYLSRDGWGMHFTLLRIGEDDILLIEQDTFTRLHSVFQYSLHASNRKQVDSLLQPILTHRLQFPDPATHLVDGGLESMIYRVSDTVYIKIWQLNPMLPKNDADKIRATVDSLKKLVHRKKEWWQE